MAAFFADSFGSGALAFLWGLLVASSGFYMFTNPGIGLATLTLVLSMLFFVSGLSECVVAFQMRPAVRWGWLLAGGVVSVLLALMIWRQFPLSGIWPVGFRASSPDLPPPLPDPPAPRYRSGAPPAAGPTP